MSMTKGQIKDHKRFFVEKGEVGFSPARNKAIIEKSIKKYEAYRARRQKDYAEQVRERADAVATYLVSRQAQGSSTPIEKYFGKRWMAYLRGQKLLTMVKQTAQGQQIIVLDDISNLSVN